MSVPQFSLPLSLSLGACPPQPKLRPHTPALALLSCNSVTDKADSISLRALWPAAGSLSLRRQRRRSRGVVCYAAPLDPHTLQWVSAVSAAVLMLAKGTAIQKSFLVPLFALQAPATVVSWIKGEYGTWTAFLALLVRLFYFIPGELDLPFFTLLLVIIAPYQTMNLRGTQAGAIISLAIAGYLGFQHFSRMTSLQRAFDQGSIIATLAVVCVTIVPLIFLL